MIAFLCGYAARKTALGKDFWVGTYTYTCRIHGRVYGRYTGSYTWAYTCRVYLLACLAAISPRTAKGESPRTKKASRPGLSRPVRDALARPLSAQFDQPSSIGTNSCVSSRCTSSATSLPAFDTIVRNCSTDLIGVPLKARITSPG